VKAIARLTTGAFARRLLLLRQLSIKLSLQHGDCVSNHAYADAIATASHGVRTPAPLAHY